MLHQHQPTQQNLLERRWWWLFRPCKHLWSLLKSRKELFLLYSIAAQSLIILPLSTSLLWSIWVKVTTISSSGGEDRVCTYVRVPACFFFFGFFCDHMDLPMENFPYNTPTMDAPQVANFKWTSKRNNRNDYPAFGSLAVRVHSGV